MGAMLDRLDGYVLHPTPGIAKILVSAKNCFHFNRGNSNQKEEPFPLVLSNPI